MDAVLSENTRFWVGCLSNVSNQTQTAITELKRMDVFEFFALLSVVEERNNKK